MDQTGIVDVAGLNFWPERHNFSVEVCALLYSHPSLPLHFFFCCYFSKTQIFDALDVLRLLAPWYIRNTTAVDILFTQAIVQLLQQIIRSLLWTQHRLFPINRQPSSAVGLNSMPEPAQLKKVWLCLKCTRDVARRLTRHWTLMPV